MVKKTYKSGTGAQKRFVLTLTVVIGLFSYPSFISAGYGYTKSSAVEGNTFTKDANFAKPKAFVHPKVIEDGEEKRGLKKRERKWFHRFWNGSLILKGWKHLMNEILEAFPPSGEEKMRRWLHHLGSKIGKEWSRDNGIRKIDTSMLRQWGHDLSKAKRKGPEALLLELNRLDATVNGILSSTKSG